MLLLKAYLRSHTQNFPNFPRGLTRTYPGSSTEKALIFRVLFRTYPQAISTDMEVVPFWFKHTILNHLESKTLVSGWNQNIADFLGNQSGHVIFYRVSYVVQWFHLWNFGLVHSKTPTF